MVISGSLFKALLKTLRSHFFGLLCAGRPVGPSTLFEWELEEVGRCAKCESNGLSTGLETLTNSKTHGVLPTEQSYGYESRTLSTLLFSLPLPRCQRCIRRHT